MMYEYISIFLGVLSIVLAVGLNWYHYHKEKNTQIKNEIFFVDQIQNNLEKMAQYFLDVENKTKRNEEYEESSNNMMYELDTFYSRNEQEMKDILYQTKLYIPFWNNISVEDKKTINQVLDTFSWLLYDYYSTSLPESIRKIKVINSRQIFFDKKDLIMTNTDMLLQKYP